MASKTISKSEVTEQFMRGFDVPGFSISIKKSGGFDAHTYWPNGDAGRDQFCYGSGSTIDAAIAGMLEKVELAKLAKRKLKTAAECKDAVLALIREHDAAPASFRDAVDELPVA